MASSMSVSKCYQIAESVQYNHQNSLDIHFQKAKKTKNTSNILLYIL